MKKPSFYMVDSDAEHQLKKLKAFYVIAPDQVKAEVEHYSG